MTSKPFSGLPIDLTLEQTINGDAACLKTGIGCFTNSISARQFWAESHFIRTKIIPDMLDDLSLNNKEDTTKDLKKGRLGRDASDLKKIKVMIMDTLNPFDADCEKEILVKICNNKENSFISFRIKTFLLQ